MLIFHDIQTAILP